MARSSINDIMDYSFTGSDVQPRVASPEPQATAGSQQRTRTSWPVGAIVIMQTILFLGHWLLFITWKSFWALDPSVSTPLAAVLLVLSLSFTVASMLSFRYTNAFIAVFY